jgi:hypothetical protein
MSGTIAQLPSSSFASGLKLQALELVQPGTSSGRVVQLNKNNNTKRKYLKLSIYPFVGYFKLQRFGIIKGLSNCNKI